MALVSWHDTFASLDTDRFGTSVAGSGSVTATGGSLVMTSPSANDAAVTYVKTAVDTTIYQAYRVKVMPGNCAANYVPCLRIMDGTAHMTGANTAVNPDIRVNVQYLSGAGGGMSIAYVDGSSVFQYWNNTTLAWSTTQTFVGTITADQTFDVAILVKAGYFRVEILINGGTKSLMQTDWVAFSALKSYTALYVCGGEAYNNYYPGTVTWYDFWYQSSETLLYGFYNGKQNATGYSIGKALTIDGKMFYRASRDAVLTPAAVGYDNVKDPYSIKVASTLYLFYAVYTTEWKIGYATSANDGDTFTNQGVIIEKAGTGWRKDGVCFPLVAYDGTTWHIIVCGLDTVWTAGYFSGTSLASLSEGASNPVIDIGASGAWNDDGIITGDLRESGGTFTAAISGLNASTAKWQGGLWTAPAPGGPYTPAAGNPVVVRVSTEGSTLASNVAAAATALVVADASPFAAGDPIVLSRASGYSATERETNRIKSIASNTLTLEYPIAEAYASGATVNCYNQGSISAGESGTDYAVMTSFQVSANLLETTSLWQNVAGTWTMLPGETPPLPLGSTWDTISSENLRLPATTFEPAPTFAYPVIGSGIVNSRRIVRSAL